MKKRLAALYKSKSHHPSGVAVLGDALFVVEGSGRLRWFGVQAAGDKSNGSIIETEPLKEIGTAGGGLGLAKMEDGTTLLIVTEPGDGFRGASIEGKKQNKKSRYTQFYRLMPDGFGLNCQMAFSASAHGSTNILVPSPKKRPWPVRKIYR